MKVLIVYYSTYGHVHKMAEAIAEGVNEVNGAEAVMRWHPEMVIPQISGSAIVRRNVTSTLPAELKLKTLGNSYAPKESNQPESIQASGAAALKQLIY